jgi:hypothetical protein
MMTSLMFMTGVICLSAVAITAVICILIYAVRRKA